MQTFGSLKKYAWLSIAAALSTIVLKGAAWWMTGSVGLMSDALESFVNLAGAMMALWMLWLAEQPADDKHPYGHGKAEYFSSAFEGALIIVAAIGIGYAAIDRLMFPKPLQDVEWGLVVSVVASVINGLTAQVLMKVGRANGSITLEADAHHLMTDVWTSVGVLVGVGLAALSGWSWLDPLVAVGVAINILWTGWMLMSRSTAGLMDAALPKDQVMQLESCLAAYQAHGIGYHALRTRQAGARSFISVHLLVPGDWTVQQAHDWAERIEADLRNLVPRVHVLTHVEPEDDPAAISDQDLDRAEQELYK